MAVTSVLGTPGTFYLGVAGKLLIIVNFCCRVGPWFSSRKLLQVPTAAGGKEGVTRRLGYKKQNKTLLQFEYLFNVHDTFIVKKRMT